MTEEQEWDITYNIARELGYSDVHDRGGVLVGCPPESLRPRWHKSGDDIPIPNFYRLCAREARLMGNPDEVD